jgi:hypothetical protein
MGATGLISIVDGTWRYMAARQKQHYDTDFELKVADKRDSYAM